VKKTYFFTSAELVIRLAAMVSGFPFVAFGVAEKGMLRPPHWLKLMRPFAGFGAWSKMAINLPQEPPYGNPTGTHVRSSVPCSRSNPRIAHKSVQPSAD
jgi:hypothetical protein